MVNYGEAGTRHRVLVDGGVGPAAAAVGAFLGAGARLELLVVTHIDNDHIGGVLESSETGAARPERCGSTGSATYRVPDWKRWDRSKARS